MRTLLLALLLSTGCAASSGPGRWRGFEDLSPKPDTTALDRAHLDGKIGTLVQKGAWYAALGIEDGPFVDIEWFGKDFVIARPRWGNTLDRAQQAERLGVKVERCNATLYRQLRAVELGPKTVPGSELICWTSDPSLILTVGTNGGYERLVWVRAGRATPAKETFKGKVNLESLVRPLCEGCNTGPGGAFYIEESALAHWKQNTTPDVMLREVDSLFETQYDYVGLGKAAEEYRHKRLAAEETARANRAEKVTNAQASFLAGLAVMEQAEKAHLSRQLYAYRLLKQAYDAANTDLSRYHERLIAIDHDIADAAERELSRAEDEHRVATAAYLRLVVDRLIGGEYPRPIDVISALRGGSTRVDKSRREVSRIASLMLPPFDGNTLYADSAYAGSDIHTYAVEVTADALLKADPTNPPWRLEVPEPVRGAGPGTSPPSPVNEAEVLIWQAKLDALKVQIEVLLANKTSATGAKKETITLGPAPYTLTITRWMAPDLGSSSDVTIVVDEVERQLDVLIDEYDRIAKLAPQPTKNRVLPPKGLGWSGPLERTVKLTIDGEERTLKQSAMETSSERIPRRAFAKLNQELAEFLQKEVRAFVEQRIADQLQLYGGSWSKDDRAFEVQLLRSILVTHDDEIPPPLTYRQIVPNL